MPHNKRSRSRNLTSDTRIEAAIGLLSALTGARGGRILAVTACRDLSLSDTQLDEVIGMLQALADTRTGSRAVIYRSGDDVVLGGTAAEIEPLRLTEDEALAVAQVLARYQLDERVRTRIEQALMPKTTSESHGKTMADTPSSPHAMVSGDALFGGFYQQLVEAIQDGVRCRISYRAGHDEQAKNRVIDPLFIEVLGDTAYLIAWDVEKDAQRRYRLDRIAGITLTDDSVETHEVRRTSPAESLRETGTTARIAFASRSQAEQVDWAGIDVARGTENPDGTFVVPVSYATESWLFDQVLAAAGTIHILSPADLRTRFLAYAETLL